MLSIVVASGKGGTGKTTVATSLALACAALPTWLVDCDVEAPNAHLIVRPQLERRQEVGILIPEVDHERCTGCGRCAQVCQYHAVAVVGRRVLVFPQLCHGCGSCNYNCPEKAIRERLDIMGVLESGPTPSGVRFARGVMQVGEAMASPIIRQLKAWVRAETGPSPHDQLLILDAPPGVSCPVVETLRGADFALLVTEPTPFGLHDLRLINEVIRQLEMPAGVIINRDGIGNAQVEKFCEAAGLPILMRIPLERNIGQGLASGLPLIDIRPEYRARFRELADHIRSMVQGKPT